MESPSNELTRRMIARLNALSVAHMLTGSLASNTHGVARATKDADLVADIDEKAVAALLVPDLVLDRQISFETITLSTRWRFRVPRGTFTFEIFLVTDDPFDRERFARRQPIRFLGEPTWVATAEDVVIQKLRWAVRARRAKDIEDAKNVIAVQANSLDWPYIRRWCDEHGSRELLEEVRVAGRVEA